MSFSGFNTRLTLTSQDELGSILSCLILQKRLCCIGFIYFLNFWEILPVKPPRPGVLFAGMFLTTISIFSGYKLTDVGGGGGLGDGGRGHRGGKW